VRDRGFSSSPPRPTVLPPEAQPSNQDHFSPPPPPPPPQQYGYISQVPDSEPDIPFDEFIQFPGTPRPQNPPFQAPPAQPEPYAQSFSCDPCQSTFSQAHEFNRHMKRHDRPYQCSIPNCPSSGFPSSQDRDRHVKARHPETVPQEQFLYCPVQTCKYATKGFARADNFQRHMKQHPGVNW